MIFKTTYKIENFIFVSHIFCNLRKSLLLWENRENIPEPGATSLEPPHPVDGTYFVCWLTHLRAVSHVPPQGAQGRSFLLRLYKID